MGIFKVNLWEVQFERIEIDPVRWEEKIGDCWRSKDRIIFPVQLVDLALTLQPGGRRNSPRFVTSIPVFKLTANECALRGRPEMMNLSSFCTFQVTRDEIE
jgi:hypothetical protein